MTGLGSVDAGLLVAHWRDFVGSSSGLSPTSAVVPATANVGSATLNLPTSTTWSASVSGGSTWLTVTPTSGTGSAPLTYSAAVNSASTARTGTITIDGQTLTVTQAAANGGAAKLSLSSSAVNFGTDQVGSAAVGQRVMVSNTGGSSLSVGQISITGTAQADYAETGTCYAGLVLVPGASCFVQVTFEPTVAGVRPATLQIGTASIALSGTGVPEFSADGPLPLWAYAATGILMLLIGARRQRSALSSCSSRQPTG